eukprot:2029026-Rhodomonas_salina.2
MSALFRGTKSRLTSWLRCRSCCARSTPDTPPALSHCGICVSRRNKTMLTPETKRETYPVRD